MKLYKQFLSAVSIGTLGLLGVDAHAKVYTIYAATSLKLPLDEIIKVYQKNNPNMTLKMNYAASSILAKQIEAGANASVFFSADQAWMDYLIQRQKINRHHSKSYLFNEIVLISPNTATAHFKADQRFNLAQSFKGYLCTAQMQSVPLGKYAKQSLQHFNWLAGLKGRIVQTNDARSALAFVERGECQRGIVYKTDALSSKKVKIIGTFPHVSHSPVIYSIALTKDMQSDAQAMKLFRFIQSSETARAIFRKYGFKY